MSVAGFGHCGAAPAARHWCFDRNVERVSFAEAGGEITDEAIAAVCLNCEPALAAEAAAKDEVMASNRWPCLVTCLPDKVPG